MSVKGIDVLFIKRRPFDCRAHECRKIDKCYYQVKCRSVPATNVLIYDKCRNVTTTNVLIYEKCRNVTTKMS